MAKTGFGARLRELFGRQGDGELFFEGLEDTLIEGDIGAGLAMEIVGELKRSAKRYSDRAELVEELKAALRSHLRYHTLALDPQRLNCLLVLGVNGVGKTTAIAKLVGYFRRASGITNIVLAAADTFRAGAIEQLRIHGERLGVRVVSQGAGSDPGAVVYDALESARARGVQLVIADTAGRMHNKANLVKELQKIDKIIRGRIGDGVYKTVLVIDATTGQNGLRQAEVFNEAVGIDSLILSKYDSAAKGGIVLAISKSIGIPISFIGTGEGPGDLEPFDPDRYLEALLEDE